jgi:hypothetical protein
VVARAMPPPSDDVPEVDDEGSVPGAPVAYTDVKDMDKVLPKLSLPKNWESLTPDMLETKLDRWLMDCCSQ